MIFICTPNLYVRISSKFIQRVTGKKGFAFDGNGEYETENEWLIKLLKQHYETKESETENSVTDDKPAEEKVFKCKHCDYVTGNKGELLAHYRKEHPKGE